MKIQDVEISTGLDRATIRFYEKENILVPERAENGYRNYSEEDVELLLKVKLLRKLGVNLPTIKALQQGSEELSDVLSQQIKSLEHQIQNDTRAREICIEMQNSSVQYSTLDTQLYLQKLSASQDKSGFHENVSREKHPVRRFVARDIDLLLTGAVVNALMIMVFRIRPCSEIFLLFVQVLSYAAVLPTEAMMLHFCGTTPGKWLMGIRLEDPNGGNLSFSAGFIRTWHVMFAGLGLFLPFFSQWRMWKAYVAVSEGEGAYWDNEAEMQYTDPKVLKIFGTVMAVLAALLLNYAAGQDAILPRYRSENLTMEKFVSNYHDYEKTFENDNTMILGENGQWIEQTATNVVIVQFGDGSHERKNFQYTFNDDKGIASISFSDSWEDISFMTAMPGYCRMALYAVVGSRPDSSAKELTYLDTSLDEQFGKIIALGGTHSGSIQIADVTIDWTAMIPEGEYYYHEGLIFNGEEGPIPYQLDFIVTIG